MNVLNKIKSKKAIIIPPSQNSQCQHQKEYIKQNTKKQIKFEQQAKEVKVDRKIVVEIEKSQKQQKEQTQQKQQKRINVVVNKFKKHGNTKLQEKTINQKKQNQQMLKQPQKHQYLVNHQEKPKIKNRMTQPTLQEQLIQRQRQVFQTQHQKKIKDNNKKQYFQFIESKQSQSLSQYVNPNHSNNFEQTNYFNNSSNSNNTSTLHPCFQYSFQKESSNNFTNIFKTTRSKQSSKEGIYFQENRLMRNQKIRANSSQDSQFELNSILKASRSKQSMNKIRKQTTTNQNYQQIQDKLLSSSFNKEVLCLMVKKGYSIGNIHIFQGEIISLKLKRLQSQFLAQNIQIQRLKLKVSCNRNIIFHSQNVLRIYLKEIIFLSQVQAIFSQKFILQIVQKSQLIKR